MQTEIILLTAVGVLGGVGIFLLAISLLTQGLQMIGGNALRTILSRWTKSPLRGIALGVAITAMLQSSSAVTAIIIGLVNSTVVTLGSAIWVIFGANVGTTMTGWLVSLTGMDFNIKAYALPFVGAGMLMKTFSRRGQINAIGTVLTGFGLFFIGVDILRDAFSFYTTQTEFSSIAQSGMIALLGLMGAGFIMTVMTQSSSAAIALILTGTAGGMLTLPSGAAMVIGANLGTTSTALLAVIGASANAKRAATAHAMFNGITACVALALLPFLLAAIAQVEAMLGIVPTPVVTLAIFHTIFNVLGVVVLMPFVPAMTRFLEKRFISDAEQQGAPKFLDTTSHAMPALAMNALVQELIRFKKLACENALEAFSKPDDRKTEIVRQERREALSALSGHISAFAGTLAQEKADEGTAASLRASLRINRYLRDLAILSPHAYEARALLKAIKEPEIEEYISAYIKKCVSLLGDISDVAALPDTSLTDFLGVYHQTKEAMLEAGAKRKISIEELSVLLDHLSAIRRMMEQAIKADRHLSLLKAV